MNVPVKEVNEVVTYVKYKRYIGKQVWNSKAKIQINLEDSVKTSTNVIEVILESGECLIFSANQLARAIRPYL